LFRASGPNASQEVKMAKAIGIIVASVFGVFVASAILYAVGATIETYAQYSEERDHAR
jgi:hypothetical protein